MAKNMVKYTFSGNKRPKTNKKTSKKNKTCYKNNNLYQKFG